MNKGKLLVGIIAVIVTLVLIFGVRTCHAQKKNRMMVYHALEVSYIGLNVADLVTTYKVIKLGGYETNPLMKPFIENKAEAIAYKTVATLGILALNRAIQKDHPKLALISLIGLNLGMGYVVHHNYQLTLTLKISSAKGLPSHPNTP